MIGGEEFSALMAALALPERPRRLAVAVSGGADSMALALLAQDWATAQGVALTALTVNHGLRPEAAAEAEQVKRWLEAADMPCAILAPATPITGSNIQEKARKARYGVMAAWCKTSSSIYDVSPLPDPPPEGGGDTGILPLPSYTSGRPVAGASGETGRGPGRGSVDETSLLRTHEHSPYLLVAHHADDQLETLLLRLVRAGGVEGLAGMRPVRAYQGITLLRPLLTIPKARLVATLQAAGQAWLEDPGNQSPAYTRNRLRPIARMLAGEGLSPERVTLLTRQLAGVADYLAVEVQDWLAVHVERGEGGALLLPLAAWQNVPPEIGWRALRRILREVGGAEKPMRSEKLLPLLGALAAGGLHKPRTLGGCLLTPELHTGMLHIRRES